MSAIMQKTEDPVIDTDAGSSVGLQTLKPVLGALLWNRLLTKFHTVYKIAQIVSAKEPLFLYEHVCWIASLPGGEEAKWLVENADRVVKTLLVISDDYPDNKDWAHDPRFLYYMYERAATNFGVSMWKWLMDSVCMGYSFAIKELSSIIFVPAENLVSWKRFDFDRPGSDTQVTKKATALCVAWNKDLDREPTNNFENLKFRTVLKRRVYQGACNSSIAYLSNMCGTSSDRIGSVFWTAASFASNNVCRWYENNDEALVLSKNNFGGDRNNHVTALDAATTFVTLEKYQLAKCMFEMRQVFVLDPERAESHFQEVTQFRGLTLEGMLKWYTQTNDRARLAVDAWTIISWRFRVVKDIRRLIANMLWADRHDWRF